MKALVTGFDAFGGYSFNPSAELVKTLVRKRPRDSFEDIEALILPTKYTEATDMALDRIKSSNPDCVLMFGLKDSASAICLERFALNIADGDDAEGIKEGELIAPKGPLTYRASG